MSQLTAAIITSATGTINSTANTDNVDSNSAITKCFKEFDKRTNLVLGSACTHCLKANLSCDGGQPCQGCIKRDLISTCTQTIRSNKKLKLNINNNNNNSIATVLAPITMAPSASTTSISAEDLFSPTTNVPFTPADQPLIDDNSFIDTSQLFNFPLADFVGFGSETTGLEYGILGNMLTDNNANTENSNSRNNVTKQRIEAAPMTILNSFNQINNAVEFQQALSALLQYNNGTTSTSASSTTCPSTIDATNTSSMITSASEPTIIPLLPSQATVTSRSIAQSATSPILQQRQQQLSLSAIATSPIITVSRQQQSRHTSSPTTTVAAAIANHSGQEHNRSSQRYSSNKQQSTSGVASISTITDSNVVTNNDTSNVRTRRKGNNGNTPEAVYNSVNRPFNYAEGFHYLIQYVREKMNRDDLMRISRALALFRPSFLSIIMNLTEEDLVFMERCFQRTLLEYEKLISFSGTPTVVWRRTGEVCLVGKEFSLLTQWTRDMLLNKKTYIYELMENQSAVEYWEKFSMHAFDSTDKSCSYSCILRTPHQKPVPCSFCFTIKRDIFDLPSVIVGNIETITSRYNTLHASNICTPIAGHCWPSIEEWNELNRTVHGNLLAVVPAAQSCYPSTNYNAEECNAYRQVFRNEVIREAYVGAMQYTNWESCGKHDRCALPPLLTFDASSNINDTVRLFDEQPQLICRQGALPRYALNSALPSDIATVIRFAQERHIALNIKNTGHDFSGKSTSPNSITIWTHGLQKIEYHDSFQPDQCTTSTITSYMGTNGDLQQPQQQRAMTIGAGVNWGTAYAAAEKHKVTLVGGASSGVGAMGGWLLGGGHSILAPSYGLGVDQVLQFKVVLANGEYITANTCQNSNLFWALRGGGVGSFGVVLEATVRAHPYIDKFQSLSLTINFTTFEAQKAYHLELARLASSFARERWGGYGVSYSDKSSAAIFGTPSHQSKEDAVRSMQPLINFLNTQKAAGDVTSILWKFDTFNGFFDFFSVLSSTTSSYSVGLNTLLSSRLIPEKVLNDVELRQQLTDQMSTGLAKISDGLDDIRTFKAAVGYFPVTPVNVPDEERETSVTPAWRSSLWHVIFTLQWEGEDESDNDYISAIAQKISSAADGLRKVTPGSGAYINEADVLEPSWHDSFWGGENYKRLLQVKEKYDPENVFHCWKCVGWNKELQKEKYKCYNNLE
ncbi:hypothetical protein BDF20DRAFT_991129 [Mycotypha africana]|uniref:uncharacterized protein n=1 Tax=Mycotypha africana TaxID=64632 RepID=UPI0023016C6A|nr:uncharacterized protein BDF20DRAFT_991129 [Mycotypha africana]KAI8969352.1 hypothetical protein BDF20DRAFT_991129 [Mycotypha africana]